MQNCQQAYVSYLGRWNRLQIDIGKFVSGNGPGGHRTKDNWNYSRSLLSPGRFRTTTWGVLAAYARMTK